MTATDTAPFRPAPALAAGLRVREIDILRGLVMVIMALDHVRDYFFAGGFSVDPLNPAQTTPLLYATRWITHLCAPTFVFLAGVSAYLQFARGKTTPQLTMFLLTRGLWLLVLEVTVLSFGWSFAFPYLFFMQVIWAIGWSMIVLAGLIWLPRVAVLAVGIAIIAGHNLLDPIRPDQFGAYSWLWQALHTGGLLIGPQGPWGLIAYPVLPWIGVIAFGYGMGALFLEAPGTRDRKIFFLGLAMLAAFVLLRGFEAYGNPPAIGPADEVISWRNQPNPTAQIMVFLDVQKYPPSLQYVLATLGAVFTLWPLLARLRGPAASFFAVFGAVPFFFYVLHIYLVHALAMAANAAAGRDVSGMFNYLVNGFTGSALVQGLGFPLYGVYIAWIAVIAILYPACRWWAGVKRTRRDWWLSYL
jgi:uncharacterized membrane protein